LRRRPCDYDEWAAHGLEEWSWRRCLPAFRGLERDLDLDAPWHGQQGPMPIRRARPEGLDAWQTALLEACASLGFSACLDHNAPGSRGAGPHPRIELEGEPIGAPEAYLGEAVRARGNLRIRARRLVRRVLFSKRKVIGLEAWGPKGLEVISASQVVLCAGAIHTPALLLRSGIGPRRELEALGIEPLHELDAVGARLLMRPRCVILFEPRRVEPGRGHRPASQALLRYRARDARRIDETWVQAGSFLSTRVADLPLLSVITSLGKPRGWGRLRLRSADPRIAPRLEAALLEDADDLEALVESVELAFLLATSASMHALARPLLPGERAFGSRAAIRQWIHRRTGAGSAPCGTVPMGAPEDPDAACDAYGRVRGLEGLFVADASLMPTIPSASLELPTMMIGERFGAWFRDGLL
ncbi:MAG: GMC family oxidoreductase N-terminal domain-containing protein, partial [Myxococcales bacterium]|nr:GMC family oxidoreductase N-terminal domain-containing protein [Myxococcales bacterium]